MINADRKCYTSGDANPEFAQGILTQRCQVNSCSASSWMFGERRLHMWCPRVTKTLRKLPSVTIPEIPWQPHSQLQDFHCWGRSPFTSGNSSDPAWFLHFPHSQPDQLSSPAQPPAFLIPNCSGNAVKITNSIQEYRVSIRY